MDAISKRERQRQKEMLRQTCHREIVRKLFERDNKWKKSYRFRLKDYLMQIYFIEYKILKMYDKIFHIIK